MINAERLTFYRKCEICSLDLPISCFILSIDLLIIIFN